MEKEDLVINKDNYKGYVALYEAQHFISQEEQEYLKKWIKSIAGVLSSSIFIFLSKALTVINPVFDTVVTIETCAFFIAAVGTIGIGFKKLRNINKDQIKKIKEQYPYVNLKIEKEKLEKCLRDAKILCREYRNGYCAVELKVEEYEDYIKAEEIKENYFKETKYDKYPENIGIDGDVFENEKIKRLVKSRPYLK